MVLSVQHKIITTTSGDRASAAAGPGLRNSLPSHLRDADLACSGFLVITKNIFVCMHGVATAAKLVNTTVHATGTGGQTTLRFISGGGWFAY